MINDENTNIATIADNINNLGIVGNNEFNATTNAKDTDIEPADTDNIKTAETEIDKSKDIVMSDNNDDNPAMSDKDSPHTIPAMIMQKIVNWVRTVQKRYPHP